MINNLSPQIVRETFYNYNQPQYNLRMNPIFQSVNTHSVRYGTESLTFLANKIWSLIPEEIQNSETLQILQKKIKLWQTDDYFLV